MILAHPIYKQAWAGYEQALLNLLASADTPSDRAAEVRGWLIAARKAKAHLERIMQDGAFAAEQIRREESYQSRWQRVQRQFGKR
jgi:hypothetical protein